MTEWDKRNPSFFAELRGRVVGIVTGPEARVDINAAAQKYLEADYPDEWIHSKRVILKITPDSQNVFAGGIHDIRRQQAPAPSRRRQRAKLDATTFELPRLVTPFPRLHFNPFTVRSDTWNGDKHK